MQLRDYQQSTVSYCVDWFRKAQAADRLMICGPTGCGKSLAELATQAEFDDCWIVTPRLEIIAGMLQKRGITPATYNQLLEIAFSLRIATPIRLRNGLLNNEVSPLPGRLILDEGHHDVSQSWQDLHTLLGYCPAIAFTATPFRGSPRSTARLREEWGEPVWMITLPRAIARGFVALPQCKCVPLVDDDEISVQNGELVASQVDAATRSRLDAIAGLVAPYYDGSLWQRPVMLSCPSRAIVGDLLSVLRAKGLSAFGVTQDTPWEVRKAAFDCTIQRRCILLQVAIVAEGVDLPIRILIDCNPTLSPVKWLQQVGRITRPCDDPPQYLCTNRNLIRHGYLLDGCLPPAEMKAAQEAFSGPGKRAAGRAIGLEALGRLKAAELPLADGTTGLCYTFAAVKDHVTTEYCVLLHPCKEEPIWARKESVRQENGKKDYGRWVACDPPEDVTGYASTPPAPISDKQKEWWEKAARRHGLDPTAQVTRKNFQALPVLSHLRKSLC